VKIPVIAAGGIATGSAMLACMSLGAEGVQIGSLFATSIESSAHDHFKQRILETKEGGTQLSLKRLVPVRLIKNEFFQKVSEAEERGAPRHELAEILGKARAKKGMFEGDMVEGELEIGQVAGLIDEILPAAKILENIVNEFKTAQSEVARINL
jgi:enoyl-[acyl-carrier protein] reductase II